MNRIAEIINNSEVTLHFSLALTDGTEALSTFNDDPITIKMGSGSFQAGMELAILGLKTGDEQSITLTPDQAYGYPNDELITDMPTTDFKADQPPQVGQIIAFSLPNGHETPGLIMAINDNDSVKVNFNHPLSGHDVVFKVKILDIR